MVPHPLNNNNNIIIIMFHVLCYAQVWNDKLAMVAQNYAEECVFAHNAARVSQQSTFTSAGENLAATTSSTNYTRLVMLWYDEIQDYDFSSNTCTQGGVCGHYTQVLLHDHNCQSSALSNTPACSGTPL